MLRPGCVRAIEVSNFDRDEPKSLGTAARVAALAAMRITQKRYAAWADPGGMSMRMRSTRAGRAGIRGGGDRGGGVDE